MKAAVAEALEPDQAARRAAQGARLAYPTETVWGLGADASRADAVARLRAFKGRGEDKPLSVLVPGREALARLEARLPAFAEALAAAFWPGPLTLVLACGARLAPGVAREDGALGIRCSPHPVASALARELFALGAGPLTATSLNRSGEPPARTRAEARAVCGEGPEAPWLVAGPDAHGSAPSSVVDATGPEPVLLREGALSAATLFAALDASTSRFREIR